MMASPAPIYCCCCCSGSNEGRCFAASSSLRSVSLSYASSLFSLFLDGTMCARPPHVHAHANPAQLEKPWLRWMIWSCQLYAGVTQTNWCVFCACPMVYGLPHGLRSCKRVHRW